MSIPTIRDRVDAEAAFAAATTLSRILALVDQMNLAYALATGQSDAAEIEWFECMTDDLRREVQTAMERIATALEDASDDDGRPGTARYGYASAI